MCKKTFLEVESYAIIKKDIRGDFMKKHELLVPAGDMECLKQAVANGADAIYVGCQKYGARKFAKNFTNAEIIEAIRLCHLYGVRLYVTMNTLVKDNEVPYFLGQIEFLYKHGIDAVIMQDFGMISLVLEKYPNLEVHASTQMNNSSVDIVKLLYQMGIKRVVLSRELSLEEITSISVPIEKEVFIHGALCISYSGCCLMSAMIGGRSGNRGECAGSCRLPYQLFCGERMIADTKYLLSTKELNTTTRFLELLNSDIYSFKIEGRMKSPEYVGFITRLYRNLIDFHCTNVDLNKENEKLKTIFNREFTCGHLFRCTKDELMNIVSPNHIGLSIGKVLSVTSDKIKIQLQSPLHQQDGIRFLHSGKGFIVNYLYDENHQLVSEATDICYVDNKVDLSQLDIVSKTLDYQLMQELKKLPARNIPVTFRVEAHGGNPLAIEISDGIRTIRKEGTIVQVALTAPMDEVRIRTQVEKLGGTPFVSTATVVSMDTNIFVNIKEINELRRALVEQLMIARVQLPYEPIIKEVTFSLESRKNDTGFSATVYLEEQIEICRKLGFKRIYVANKDLYQKYKRYDSIYYQLPRCMFHLDHLLKGRTLVRDYADFSLEDSLIGDYTLNVFNVYTAYYLYKMGLSVLTLSVELSFEEVSALIQKFYQVFSFLPNIELIGYGSVDNMVIKDNILELKPNSYLYKLRDLRERRFPVYFDGERTIVLNFEKENDISMFQLKDKAVIRFLFFDESPEQIAEVVKKYR